ncbi:DUF2016 domain-containing protein [Sphingobium sp. AntQ-1]|uniref:DUF2016 domain-containing protein n=1 Tax=Sphingobium sp. AntQ-1 TaxID=2930091 RepID=UPI003FA75DED
MTLLADDPTAAAVLSAVPCYPVPPRGRSPALDALRAARTGHGLAIGNDGVMLILRRAWLALDVSLTPPISAYLPLSPLWQCRRAKGRSAVRPDPARASCVHSRAFLCGLA